MAATLLVRFSVAIGRLESAIAPFLGRRPPPDEFCLATDPQIDAPNASIPSAFNIKDLIGDGFLWAVPKSRRTLEKRHKRRYGVPEYVEKILRPKTNIRTCNVCGDDHQVGVLCPTCYKRVVDETKEMQEAIQNELKLSPVEQEVVVLYEGEKNKKPNEFWEGKRIVEIAKPRPQWFSKNLLEETTQQPATTSDIKPSDLG